MALLCFWIVIFLNNEEQKHCAYCGNYRADHKHEIYTLKV